jgi:alkylation response protein AidB-like acyl-CoA dehydrogenase
MDFRLSEEQEHFRDEVRAFLDKEVTDEMVTESESRLGFGPQSWVLMRKLGEKRWLAPSFPREYGGLGASHMYRSIVAEELSYRRVLSPVPGLGIVGVDMVAPVLLHFGSEEQKQTWLPRIARGEIEFALGYTEPQAGSDLAAVQIRAEEKTDCYVISGQKTFNTGCHYAQYHWLLARTEINVPAHKSLSMFVVDMKSPGITINPIWTMGGHRTNEVFYDNVQVPKENLIGERNMGWHYVTTALDLERTMCTGHLKRDLEELVEYINKVRDGMPPSSAVLVRRKLAELAIDISVAETLSLRVAWLQDSNIIPKQETAVLKVFITELIQRLANTGMQILGLYGQLTQSSELAPIGGRIEKLYRMSVLDTIGGGTSEVMRNIIALRGLELPRR